MSVTYNCSIHGQRINLLSLSSFSSQALWRELPKLGLENKIINVFLFKNSQPQAHFYKGKKVTVETLVGILKEFQANNYRKCCCVHCNPHLIGK